MRTTLRLAVLLASALFLAVPFTASAEPLPTPAEETTTGSPAPASDADRYADREARATPAVQEFQGGDGTLYVTGGAVTVILIVVLLVVLL
jgi:hypothetical protein